jgi:hypothetical protein
MNLRAKHDRSEKQEEQSFEAEDERDYNSDWRSEICAALNRIVLDFATNLTLADFVRLF